MSEEKYAKSRICNQYVIFTLLILTCIGIGIFLNEKKSTEAQNIPLEAGGMINVLSFSKEYFYEKHDSNTLTIHVEYPEMLPNHPKEIFSMEKAIRIYLTVEGVSGTDEVKTFLRHVEGNGCGNETVCYARKITSNNQYELFQEGTQNDYANKNNKARKYYLFKAYDGQSILLEDAGEWARTYRVKRNIDGYLLLDYQFPRHLESNKTTPEKIKHDFIVIDKVVTEFIKSHLKYGKFTRKNKENAS